MTFANQRCGQFEKLTIFALLIFSTAAGFAAPQADPYASLKPWSGSQVQQVDTTSLKGKVMCGYQGWFAAEGDGSRRGWVHYGGPSGQFAPGNCSIDLWPDVSELEQDEKFPTEFRHADGRRAFVFSPYAGRTVTRHFQWMQATGVDGVFLQRFGTDLRDPQSLNHRNVVMRNVRSGANKKGRTWALMYDLSGLEAGEIEKVVMADWRKLVDRMKIGRDPAYLQHNGKPLVAIWGVGFNDGRKYSLEECERLIKFLKSDSKYGNNTVMLGVPAFWRTLNRDAVSDQRLHAVIEQADIISPWTVGRYQTPAAAENHANEVTAGDLKWAREKQLDYLPVIFPGFSWQNLQRSRGAERPLNEIPRLGGQFLWSQAAASRKAGAEMLYVAMFDELDEGTAIFKCTNDPPVGDSQFLDFEGLPSDHYLWVTGLIGQMLRGAQPPTPELPTGAAWEEAKQMLKRTLVEQQAK
jgi:hypothetical protein